MKLMVKNEMITAQAKPEYGFSIYVLGLVLMLAVALAAQTFGNFPLTSSQSDASSANSREPKNSPEVGN